MLDREVHIVLRPGVNASRPMLVPADLAAFVLFFQPAHQRFEVFHHRASGDVFAGSFSSGVMFPRHIGNREPLRLAVYAKERLIPRVGENKKTIYAFLNRRLCRSEGDETKNEREQEQEKEARNSWTMQRRLPEATKIVKRGFLLEDGPLDVQNRISSAARLTRGQGNLGSEPSIDTPNLAAVVKPI